MCSGLLELTIISLLASKPISIPKTEEDVLKYWTDIDAFKTSQKLSEGKPEYSFYDGPPFATGKPHYGHLLAGTIKDIVTRHAHSTGHHVERRFGWDTHGLPVEHEIDKTLNIKGKEDVMAMGIDKYNAACREIVMRYSGEWKSTVERMGRWIDFDTGYKTLDPTFMESVWWVFGQLWQKGQVYRGLRVMPYSTGCTTPLSNFEAGEDYRMTSDPAVTVTFPLVDDPSTSLLAWTTTPYTLPSNLALCVHPDFTYIKIYDYERDQNFILLESLLGTVYKELAGGKKDAKKDKDAKPKFKKVGQFVGKDMVGWRYIPMFDHFTEQYEDRAFRVLSDTYVTDTSGTGIVHQAPAFGEDDHRIAVAHNVVRDDEIPPCPIDESGKFTAEVPEYQGKHVKEADPVIIKELQKKGRLIVRSDIMHSYPFCWRSGTPLIYRAIPSWFIRVANISDKLVANNEKTRWVPANVGEGRFGGWIRNARDWNISRNRYWGTPIPLWVSEDYEEIVAVGSIAELEKLSGVTGIKDLHRESIDNIEIPSQQGKGKLRRIEEVFDCWFESGSMPYAQSHYPFENQDRFQKSYPADFVSEGIDQTRGWFYTLLVLGTHLYDTAPWKNLIVTGLVLAADGKKMSKKLKNYPDPMEVVNKYGADCVRLFLVNSPVVRADNLRFREEGVREILANVILKWINSLNFYLGQAELFERTTGEKFVYDHDAPKSSNVMDRWILATCQTLIQHVDTEMGAYRLYTVIPRLLDFIADLTNWYIRFNRTRLKGIGGVEDTRAALNTLYEALYTLCLTMSSFTPFTSETVYQALRPTSPAPKDTNQDVRSIHFLPFPSVRQEYFDLVIERQVKRMRAVIDLGRLIRDRKTLKVKIPLKELVIFHHDQEYLDDVKSLESYIAAELNVVNIVYTTDESKTGIKYRATADWPTLGKKLRKDLGKVRSHLPKMTTEECKQYVNEGKVSVNGVELVEGDLIVTRFAEVNPEDNKFDTASDNDVIIVLDIQRHPELETLALLRSLTSRVNKLRKEAGLKPSDKVEIYYTVDENEQDYLKPAIAQQEEYLLKTLGNVPVELSQKSNDKEIIETEKRSKDSEDLAENERFVLSLALV
ncbi:isoleucine-tRNA ligase [Kwoniella mangroviensis CBS 10435]|uniref:Isoleucine--tRNA ligase, cytoplasmic n=1 Tax=Kwoniella mangroviensis CBS 10435 TaxID=1331196 RepID=A0A1B9IYG5_9TREE|nr:isoleucine-tRNA ligase [Kwoniella mangroviensis CBS 8507]OCF60579.1 isoleucine-tRNA ligase [Kwoniella mangroviensis CBS 10435]OCF70756.1 isoleucine-tRNA ligase [Kwoniella mangroviensis CBS 8507]OCF74672.1 isoleucine-tRNA ligase [Kwoniella mangroviensis CBS 8886]